MKRSYSLLYFLAAALILTGCQTALPRTTALKAVHDTYRADFAALTVPAPSAAGNPSGGTNNFFNNTLRSIRDFRVSFSNAAPAELAHLTVLEGMIYLQAGRPGMARLAANEVAAAGTRLSSTSGTLVRDGLFAENFSALIGGWTEVADADDQLPAGGANTQTNPESAKFLHAADSIAQNLIAHANKNQLQTPETDEAALYLATTVGIFYAWAVELKRETEAPDAETVRQEKFAAARELIGRFLSPMEKTAAGDLKVSESIPSGRLRYLQWYQWLSENSR